MKTVLAVLITAAALAGEAPAQPLTPDQVPASLKEAFRLKFPDVSKVEWKLKSDHNYEAEFKRNGVEVAAKFDANGRWLETETTVTRAKLPVDVRTTISRQFGGYKIIETQTVERFDQKQLLYEVHLEDMKEVLKTLFEENGTLRSQSSKPKRRT